MPRVHRVGLVRRALALPSRAAVARAAILGISQHHVRLSSLEDLPGFMRRNECENNCC